MHATVCPNCYYSIQGRYCASCGQGVLHHADPSVHDIVHDGIHEFFHLDGKIFRTLKTLFISPGKLTLSFLKGQRASYINPLRLYLTMSVLYFVLSSFVSPVQHMDIELPKGVGAKIDANLAKQAKQGTIVGRISQYPGIKNFGTRFEKNPREFVSRFAKAFPKAVFLLVPIFALILQASFGFRQRYPQFLYFALHIHAAYFGLLIVSMLFDPFMETELIMLLWAAVYFGIAMKRVWGSSSRAAALRVVGVGFVYGIVFLTSMILVTAYAMYDLSA